MKFDNSLQHSDGGLSKVIGVVLLIAIVVIIAGVVGFFAVGLNDNTDEESQAGVTSDESQEGYEIRIVNSGNSDQLTVLVNGREKTSIDGSVGESVDLTKDTQICEGDKVTVVGTTGDSETVLNSDTVSSDVNCQLQGTNTDSTATYNGSSWIVDTFLENTSLEEKRYVLTLSNGSDQQVTETVTLQPGESTTIQSKESSYSGSDPISVGVYSPSSDSSSTNSDYTLTGGSISYSGSSSPSYSGGPTAESYTYTPSGTDGTTVNSTDSPSTISTDSKDGSTLSLSTSRVKAGETVKAFATLTTTKEPEATETLTLYATETNSSSKIISQSEHTIQNGKEKTVSSSFSISTPNEYIISASLDGSDKIYEVGTLTVVDDSNYSVSNISMTPSDPTTDDELTFTADITNSGSDSGTTTVEFFEGGDAFVSKEVSVGASSTKTVSGSYTPSEEKVYNFHIGVVEPAIIKEVSEVYIGDPTPVSVSVSESSDFVQPETEVTLNVDSSSHSDSDVSIVEYTWSIGDESVTTDSTSYSTTLNTEKVYEYTVTAIASNGDTGVDSGSIIVSSSATAKVSEPHTSYKDVPLSELDGSGTEADPYVITNDWELDSMKQDTRAHYVLGNDIDASGTAKWDTSFKHIVRFHGTLDGKGHEIIGPHIRRTSNWAGKIAISGFIRELDGGTVRNIGLRNPTVIGDEETGGLVGFNYTGTIKNAYVIGGDISGGNNYYSDTTYSAGIVGRVDTDSTVTQVYSTASVNHRGAVGECNIRNDCDRYNADHIYWNTETSGVGSDGAARSVGLTTSEMKGDSAKTNMSGLDFKNTWKTVDGGYPVLQKSD